MASASITDTKPDTAYVHSEQMMTSVFFSYSHRDEDLRDQLEVQLAMLKHQGIIQTWHDRRIVAGQELDGSISDQLLTANIVLLLVSPDFLASEYCYDKEMAVAMERDEKGEAAVIPGILRPCDWHPAPIGKLRATPTDSRPVTQWSDRDIAMLDVVKDIRRAAERFATSVSVIEPAGIAAAYIICPCRPAVQQPWTGQVFHRSGQGQVQDRSLRVYGQVLREFSVELAQRNNGIDGDFRQIDSNRFTAAVYRGGKAITRCTVFMGGGFSTNGISYVDGETTESNGYRAPHHGGR